MCLLILLNIGKNEYLTSELLENYMGGSTIRAKLVFKSLNQRGRLKGEIVYYELILGNKDIKHFEDIKDAMNKRIVYGKRNNRNPAFLEEQLEKIKLQFSQLTEVDLEDIEVFESENLVPEMELDEPEDLSDKKKKMSKNFGLEVD